MLLAKYTGKIPERHPSDMLLFYSKGTLSQVLSCEFWVIFRNTYFAEHLRMAATAIAMRF